MVLWWSERGSTVPSVLSPSKSFAYWNTPADYSPFIPQCTRHGRAHNSIALKSKLNKCSTDREFESMIPVRVRKIWFKNVCDKPRLSNVLGIRLPVMWSHICIHIYVYIYIYTIQRLRSSTRSLTNTHNSAQKGTSFITFVLLALDDYKTSIGFQNSEITHIMNF